MADIDLYKEKFSESGVLVLEEAIEESRKRGKNFISVALIILALAVKEKQLFSSTLEKLSINPITVKEIVLKHVELGKKYKSKGFQIAPAVTELFKRAMERARAKGRWQIDSTDIFILLSEDKNSLWNEILSEFEVEPEEVALSTHLAIRKKTVQSKSTAEKDINDMTEPVSKRIFVVHGRDELSKITVARFLENLKLEAIILHEQSSSSRTIIEKLENYSDVTYAVVLLTPDDVGTLVENSSTEKKLKDKLTFRARQNVIFELGYFVGKLGRAKVCALYKGNIELPTDFAGVVYVAMDENGAWKQILARELDEGGLNIDHKGLLK